MEVVEAGVDVGGFGDLIAQEFKAIHGYKKIYVIQNCGNWLWIG